MPLCPGEAPGDFRPALGATGGGLKALRFYQPRSDKTPCVTSAQLNKVYGINDCFTTCCFLLSGCHSLGSKGFKRATEPQRNGDESAIVLLGGQVLVNISPSNLADLAVLSEIGHPTKSKSTG